MKVTGLAELERMLRAWKKAAELERSWWVGTIVEYAIYPELGTRRMPAYRYFLTAVERLLAQGIIGSRSEGQEFFRLLVSEDGSSIAWIALKLEREVKVVIREMGLIDTGNLRASFAAGPTLSRMVTASRSRLLLPESEAS